MAGKFDSINETISGAKNVVGSALAANDGAELGDWERGRVGLALVSLEGFAEGAILGVLVGFVEATVIGKDERFSQHVVHFQ